MAQHGYLGDGYGMRGDHGDDDFDREREHSFSDRSRERSYGDRDRFRDNERDRDFGGRDRNFMFDQGRQHPRSRDDFDQGRHEREGWGSGGNRMSGRRDQDDGRGWTDRARETARDWFGDDNDDHRSQGQNRGWGSDDRSGQRPTFGGFGNQTGWESGRGHAEQRSRPTPHRDDHYRSWREKQMQALDRDYEEYCRDCEQKFHQDFDSWRQNRQQQGQSRETGTSDESEQVRVGSDRPKIDSPRAGTDPNGTDATDFIGGTEVGVGGQADHGAVSVGAGSELGGAVGSMVNEGTGGGGRRKPV